jgi:hypothetical protein
MDDFNDKRRAVISEAVKPYLISGEKFIKTSLCREIIKDNPELFKKDKDSVENCRQLMYREIRNFSQENVFSNTLTEAGFGKLIWKDGWLKSDGASIRIVNPDHFEEFQNGWSDFLEDVKSHAIQYPPGAVAKGDRLVVIDPADVHIGKLCAKEETGYDYDIEIARERMLKGIVELMSEIPEDTISQIVFVAGNDILHTDNTTRGTTKGTPQDTDGQWWQMFKTAKLAYVSAIDYLRDIAPVKVIHCPSNHDFMSGFMLADSLESWYNNADNVTFDSGIQQRKYLVYGANLIGFSHGDGAKHSELQFLMTKEARNYISSTRYRYFYIHHGHHKDRRKYQGKGVQSEKDLTSLTVIDSEYTPPEDTVNVEMVRSPSPPDPWHAKKGYLNEQALEAFVHCPHKGQIGRFTTHF